MNALPQRLRPFLLPHVPTILKKARDKACRRAAQGKESSLRAYLKQFEAWIRGGLKGVPMEFIEEIQDEIRVAAEKGLLRNKATSARMTRKQKISNLKRLAAMVKGGKPPNPKAVSLLTDIRKNGWGMDLHSPTDVIFNRSYIYV